MSYSASFMACQIPLKLGLPSGPRGARYAVGALGFAALGVVAPVAGAVCANDREALKHNAHTVSVIAILKALFPDDTLIRRPVSVIAWAGSRPRCSFPVSSTFGKDKGLTPPSFQRDDPLLHPPELDP